MTLNLSIKGVPDDVAERLRARAERNHRSLQGELMAIVTEAAAEAPLRPGKAPSEAGTGVRVGWKTIEQTIAEMRAEPRSHAARRIPLAVDIIRADRDSR